MHLLNVDTYKLQTFYNSQRPRYAILSHTWGAEEITFADIQNPDFPSTKNVAGYDKIVKTCKQAKSDGHQYAWIDTCCINKSSSAELSEAINSKYQWYKESVVCYAYLADTVDVTKLTESRWFTRGWTLQELLAPARVVFFNADWQHIGTKDTLIKGISKRTGIPENILQGGTSIRTGIAQKMSWASQRETTRIEDMAYCLLGIFDVNMPLLYGEGSRAFNRLQEEILQQSKDPSLLAWRIWTPDSDFSWVSWDHVIRLQDADYDCEPDDRPNASRVGILAQSPKDFANSGCIETLYTPLDSTFLMTNGGLRISIEIVSTSLDLEISGGDHVLHVGLLRCAFKDRIHQCVGIPLIRTVDGIYHRVVLDDHNLSTIPVPPKLALKAVSKEIYILSTAVQKATERWQDWGRMEESILLDASGELELNAFAAFDEMEHIYMLDASSNELQLSSVPGRQSSRLHHIVIILYSSAFHSVLTVLVQVPNILFDEEGHKPNVLLRAMESDNPVNWLKSKIETHCRHALETRYYDSNTESSNGSQNDYSFAASLETREIVNQRIYLVHLSMQDPASGCGLNGGHDSVSAEVIVRGIKRPRARI